MVLSMRSTPFALLLKTKGSILLLLMALTTIGAEPLKEYRAQLTAQTDIRVSCRADWQKRGDRDPNPGLEHVELKCNSPIYTLYKNGKPMIQAETMWKASEKLLLGVGIRPTGNPRDYRDRTPYKYIQADGTSAFPGEFAAATPFENGIALVLSVESDIRLYSAAIIDEKGNTVADLSWINELKMVNKNNRKVGKPSMHLRSLFIHEWNWSLPGPCTELASGGAGGESEPNALIDFHKQRVYQYERRWSADGAYVIDRVTIHDFQGRQIGTATEPDIAEACGPPKRG